MFKKVLVANRGEIACRIQKTLKSMGITSVAIYSEADRFHPHVKMADEAYCVGPAKPQASYLNIDKIMQIAKTADVDAIHPGYGFLSENPEFAQACEQHQIKFIGPNTKAMQLVGSKQAAKQALKDSKVPLIPGFGPPNPSDDDLIKASETIGFPLVIKAAHGGGGKGIRIVKQSADFKHALASARREALHCFNNDELLLEKQIVSPRHLEVQILADEHGQIRHLFERDCSVQRRQQKIIEEAPALNLNEHLRQELYNYALTVARTMNYTNAGTVEFLLSDDQQLYFMEMNARLQVEHPVTEMITGIDLVEWQIRIAQGEKINFPQAVTPNGHAIEARICAEQPQLDFRPSQGSIQQLHFSHLGRIDSGIECHQKIGGDYDSLLAKAISWGNTRQQAILELQDMLNQTHILGLATNMDYLKTILSDAQWQSQAVEIDFLTKHHFETDTLDTFILCLAAAALAHHDELNRSPVPKNLIDFSGLNPRYSPYTFMLADDRQTLWLRQDNDILYVRFDEQEKIHALEYQIQNHQLFLSFNEQTMHFNLSKTDHAWILQYRTQSYPIRRISHQISEHNLDIEHNLKAPMNATVVALYKSNGELIEKGEPLLVLEAMKMEHTIYAPDKGKITEIYYQLGQQVQEGSLLLEIHYG